MESKELNQGSLQKTTTTKVPSVKDKHTHKPHSKMKTKMKPKRYYDLEETESKQQNVFKADVKQRERVEKWKHKQANKQRQTGSKTAGDLTQMRKKQDPFPGDRPIPTEKINKYERGHQMKDTSARTVFASKSLKKKEKKLALAAKQSARTEFLMQEDAGYLEPEADEETSTITQHDIADAVDITSAQKFFELKMTDFGPYRINYTRNGRFLLFGGGKGHVAAIDWMTKKLLCEINVMETLHDVREENSAEPVLIARNEQSELVLHCFPKLSILEVFKGVHMRWLHQETMYAVAQKQWTYIYDNQGIELHCLKVLDSTLRMEFLPYHFLLAAANSKGYLSYIDVSVGEKVAGYSTGMGRLDVMCQNPSNAVVCLGHTSGTVTMWCPKVKEPIAKMLCHKSGVRSVAVDNSGNYMASSGIDRTLKIWDLRTYKQLQSYKIAAGAGQLTFSQTGCLAAGMGNVVEVYKDCCRQTVLSPYLVHNFTSSVNSVQFCPYEDVLGAGHGTGFSSLIVPGAGEANFDALEANPYQNKKQRRQAEVKMLLEKIPADMIHLSTAMIGQVDKKTLQDKVDEHNKIKYGKPQKLEFEPKYKKKGRSKGSKVIKRKKGVIEEHNREHIKQSLALKQQEQKQNREKKLSTNRTSLKGGVLDRFKRKEAGS